MGVRIDESRKHDFADAVDFANLFAILLYPGVVERVFGLANGNDLAAHAEDRAVFDQAEATEVASTARSGAGRKQGEELADVDQEQRASVTHVRSLQTTPTTETRRHGALRSRQPPPNHGQQKPHTQVCEY